MSGKEQVYFAEADDEMEAAFARARATFKYFWRELAWEQRRIVKGLDVAAVKAPFDDGEDARHEGPEVEQMWLGDVQFDGDIVAGTLLNAPNWLRSIRQGDFVELPLGEITDWMYAQQGRVYGGFTVDVTRKRMSSAERRAHDSAWGLDFGEVGQVELVPSRAPKRGMLASLFGSSEPVPVADPDAEHPMSENIAAKWRGQIVGDRGVLTYRDEHGWTQLHHMALAGSAANVALFLELGADPNCVPRMARRRSISRERSAGRA